MLYVFEVTTQPGYAPEQYADAWVRASRLIQQAPGARGTRLHRSLDSPERLLAIARWDSKADRDAMEQRNDERVAAIIASAAPYITFKPIGSFADPEWVVLPDDADPDGPSA